MSSLYPTIHIAKVGFEPTTFTIMSTDHGLMGLVAEMSFLVRKHLERAQFLAQHNTNEINILSGVSVHFLGRRCHFPPKVDSYDAAGPNRQREVCFVRVT